ncbi:MAG: energy transducer TonB [Candidatus Omnitrophota bacterium]
MKISAAVIAIFVCALLSCALPGDCRAREAKSAQGQFALSNDFRYYQITYEQEERDAQSGKVIDIKATPPVNEPVYGKGYIDYYQLIREKIKEELKYRYRRWYKEGDVILNFILKSDGTLIGFDTDKAASTGDARLAEIASLSIKQASPFPPFPEGLPFPQMSFTVTVSFKEK